MTSPALSVSLIITTYNRPDALDLVLTSALRQSVPPQEIIVADDGSQQATADLIRRFQTASAVPIIHSWQPDAGFRAARSRNLALARAKSDYIVLIDGDMVLHPDFIRDHLAVAEAGVWVQGSRVLLSEKATAALLSAPLPEPYCPPFYAAGIMKKLAAIRCDWLRQRTAGRLNRDAKSVKSCNMGFFLADALAINGFDNEFVGWGREDSEFAARLYHHGLWRRNLKFGGLAYHLWHHEAERDALPENDARLCACMTEQRIRSASGIEELRAEAGALHLPLE